jgi:hypothetical protein
MLLSQKRMNVFSTEHPMESVAFRYRVRLRRWVVGCLLAYPTWLLLLGPFWALDGSGTLDFIPSSARRIVYLPAAPFFYVEPLCPVMSDYLNWWHQDPNEAETTW